MNFKSFSDYLIENKERAFQVLAIAVVALVIFRSCYSVSQDSLPKEVQDIINARYGSCVEVPRIGRAPALDGPSRVCTELTVNVLGQGSIPQQDQAGGISEAICFRVLIEKPYMTVNENIPSFDRIASKVALLQEGEWVLYPDQYSQDGERWEAYGCPGAYDISLEEWLEEY